MLGERQRARSASRWKIGWLSFDSLGALLTPGAVMFAGDTRQILDHFVNQETQQHRSNSSLFVFVIRKTLNQRSLWFRAMTQSLGHRIAGTRVQRILPSLDCCHQPEVLKWGCLMRIVETMQKAVGQRSSAELWCCGSRPGVLLAAGLCTAARRTTPFPASSIRTPRQRIDPPSVHFVLGITADFSRSCSVY